MKRNNIYHILVTIAFVCLCTVSSAQSLRSGYFLEGYTYRHLMNPAFSPERNYIAVPGIGNINVGAQSNVGLNTFIYPYGNDKLTTFMNSSISNDDFLGKLKDNNRINVNLNMTLLSAGFRAWGGFNTIDVNMRSTTSLNLPRGLFEFMKLGMNSSNSVYEMDDLGISSNNYAEIALGHSRQINDKLNVGGKLKFLLGVGNVNIKMTDMKVQMAEDKWMVQANGEMNTSVKGLTIPTKEESGKEIKKWFNTSGLKYKSLNLKEKLPNMTDEEKIKLLASDGMLIKRPILISDKGILIGFKETDWEVKLCMMSTKN